MSNLIWSSDKQMRLWEPHFPLPHVDDRRVLSGIIFVIRNGLRWRDAPADYGPHKTLYNQFIRWRRLDVFNQIFAALSARDGQPDQLMIDATHLKARRTAASLLKKGIFPDVLGAPKAVYDDLGRPLLMLLSEGQMSDYKGAALMIDAFPEAKTLLADKGYDANWFRAALEKRRITACIPSTARRKRPLYHDVQLYRQRHKIENMTSGASRRAMIEVLTHSSLQYASLRQSSLRSINQP